MAHTSIRSPLLDCYIRGSEHGNHTSIDIAAPPSVVWTALHHVSLKDCRTTGFLSALRTIPGRLSRRGAYGSDVGVAAATDVPLFESMRRDRFVTLDEVPTEEVILGVIGQFWKLGGGTDAPITDGTEFLAFDTPGYVKAAFNFRVDPAPGGCMLTTETRCVATDPGAARRFSIYWALISWGSKLIRHEILTAVRRRAETA